jgi:hypothetical protein
MSRRALIGTILLSLSCSNNKAATNPPMGGTGGPQTGTGGRGPGTGGTTGGTGTGGGGPTSTGNSVLERNNHPSRDGHFMQPTLTKAAAATMTKDAAFSGAFTGSMWASPLYLENGPGGKGVFFAVTTGNDVIALDESTGAVVWTHNIGSSPTASGAGCGSISPIGILSTPVIDPQSRTIYVAGAIGTASITRHEVHALSVDDGTEKTGWPVNVSSLTAGTLAFNTMPQNQRSALSLVGGVVYVAYGGHVGDCGTYHGWVVGINAADPTMRGAWATGGVGEGLWAPGGMASDGTGVFASTGNSTNGAATHLDSEEIVRITGLGTLDRTNANLYYPASWRTMDSQDADFSSVNPIYVEVPGATPSTLVVAIAKDGHMYLLDSKNLGGMGGHVVDLMVSSGAMSIHTVPVSYRTAQGVHVAFSTTSGATCPTGMPSGRVVMSVLIPAGAPPAPRTIWCAALTSTSTTRNFSGPTAPIVTTTDGSAEAIVWYMSNSHLIGVDGDTGAVIYNGGAATENCTNVHQWTSPIAVKGRIVVGGDGHLCSWSSH